MKPLRFLLISLTLLFSGVSCAQDEQKSLFDYWVLSLSWSPQYCAEQEARDGYGISGNNNQSYQCNRNYAFVVHGLWPQYETGFPSDCNTGDRVDNELADRMLALMPDVQLIRHQWRKHGACSGLSVKDYFMTTESAYRNFVIPDTYQEAQKSYVTTNLLDLKREFMTANPQLDENEFVLQCSGRFLKEIRVCYDRRFHFRSCGDDVQDRCKSNEIVLRPRR